MLDISGNRISDTKELFLQTLGWDICYTCLSVDNCTNSVLENLAECSLADNPVVGDLVFHHPISPATKSFLLAFKEACPAIVYLNEIKIDKLLCAVPVGTSDESIFHTWFVIYCIANTFKCCTGMMQVLLKALQRKKYCLMTTTAMMNPCRKKKKKHLIRE